ncbi:hypothetical protein E2C01_075534 [Portunus trituberculatus]|uniref:Uncharacterized protein n=1 Tax=Portunus trituberculatus TaxID=210409 RepID=A0A5B7IG28_PORTR|nr:hypothetical protein [Portunus trituberculatus]
MPLPTHKHIHQATHAPTHSAAHRNTTTPSQLPPTPSTHTPAHQKYLLTCIPLDATSASFINTAHSASITCYWRDIRAPPSVSLQAAYHHA